MRVLVLGGTSEATLLAKALALRADIAAVLSLAGRTRNPVLPPIPHRIGGFGGAEGLTRYLVEGGFHAVIDATHPFAERISANARTACLAAEIPLAAFTRPGWTAVEGDRWTEVPSAAAAVQALGEGSKRVFLTVGRLQLPEFTMAPQHDYLVRTIDPPDPSPVLPLMTLLLARGPFELDAELKLLRDHAIDIVVTKNSGGTATYPKIAAARQLGLPVVLISRKSTDQPTLYHLDSVLEFLESHRP